MKKCLLLLSALYLFNFQSAVAQNILKQSFKKINTISALNKSIPNVPLQRNCGTMESLDEEMKKDPTLKQRMDNLEIETQKQITKIESSSSNKVSTVYKIPVVVHVVYSNATENVSDAQIYSQLVALNRDYRKQNADFNLVPSVFAGLGADIEIEFCMASIDPNGNATNGITRTQTSNMGGFSNTSNDVKSDATQGKSPWNTSKYLNMWVCDLQGSLLGYAQFPGGAAATDGVVIDYAYFGTTGTATAPFALGRTATHEVGHYLNLRHIWGDAACGDDFISDTPTQQTSNGQCPQFPHVTCNNGPDGGDMFMNYMDYVDDACMQIFTSGQKSRMIAALTGPRANLLTNTSYNCTIPTAVLSCDTIAHYTGSNNLTLYRPADVSQPGTGFISGTNSFGDIGFAEKFNPLQAQQKIYGVLIGFAAGYGLTSSSFNVKVWKADFAGGAPGTVLAAVTVALGDIVPDINAGNYSAINFSNPISVSSSYYIGIEFNAANIDTIALYTTVNGQVTTGKAYEEYDTGAWYPFTDATNSWGVNVALAVAPRICIDFTGINDPKDQLADDFEIYPNPTNGYFTLKSKELENEKIELFIYNSIGKLVDHQRNLSSVGDQISFDLSEHPRGLYMVEARINEHSVVKKINLIH